MRKSKSKSKGRRQPKKGGQILSSEKSIIRLTRMCIPKVAPESGGCFQITLSNTSTLPGSHDKWGIGNTGFKITDFVEADLVKRFDAFRILNVKYTAHIATRADADSNAYCHVFSRVCEDKIDTPTTAAKFLQLDALKKTTLLYSSKPSAVIADYSPRRRLSTNADPSLWIVPKPNEWCDTRYGAQLLFGNLAFLVLSPDGSTNGITVTSMITFECRGIINV